VTLSWVIWSHGGKDKCAIAQLFPSLLPAGSSMLFPQILDSFKQLLPLVIPVPPPRLRQAEHESGRVRLLGRLEGGFEFLADPARLELGFHLA